MVFTHYGCPWCAASLLFPRTQCPVHTLPPCSLLHGIGLITETGHVSIALLPTHSTQARSEVGVAANQGEAQQWCSSCENPVQPPNDDSKEDIHGEQELPAAFIRVILVPEALQVNQWFNAGSLTTFLCRSSQIAAASKKMQQPLSYDHWQQYLGLPEEHQQQFLQHYLTLCVWGNEALISRTCRVLPIEADLRT